MFARRASSWAITLCVSLAVAAGIASAAKLPGVTRLSGTPVKHVSLPGYNSALTVCQLGEHGAPFGTVNIVDMSGDDGYGGKDPYFTWVAAQSCTACVNTAYANVTAAHVALYFPTYPETVTVSVSVVNVNRINCRYEDPSVSVCPATTAKLIAPEALSTVDFAIPLTSTCHLDLPPNYDGQGFLFVDFVSESDTVASERAQLAVQQAGYTCRSYNEVGVIRDDVVVQYLVGNPIMYLDVESCASDPVRKRSWGGLKILYR